MEVYANEPFLEHLAKQKLLVVGAGGIGCEIFKQFSVGPFRDIQIVRMWPHRRSISILLRSVI